MAKKKLTRILKEQGEQRVILIFNSILDAFFLVVWVIIQWGVNQLLQKFPLSGVEKGTLVIFQWGFALSTLVPIVTFIFKDAAVIVIRVSKTVWQELKVIQPDVSKNK